MKAAALMAAVFLCSCSAGEQAAPAPNLHAHMAAASKQVTPIDASDSVMAESVSQALAAKSLRVVSSDLYASCGRVAAVDSQGVDYVVSWERASTSPSASDPLDCVLLFVSCDSGAGSIGVGELAEAVRVAAESAG